MIALYSIYFTYFLLIFKVLLLAFPIQIFLVKVMFTQRKKGVKITDKRIRLTTEVCLIHFLFVNKPDHFAPYFRCFRASGSSNSTVGKTFTLIRLDGLEKARLRPFGKLRTYLVAVFSYADVDIGSAISIARSVLVAMFTFIPILASILSFVSFLFLMPCEGVKLTPISRSRMH